MAMTTPPQPRQFKTIIFNDYSFTKRANCDAMRKS